jgi:SAM-dependent methyltransferase
MIDRSRSLRSSACSERGGSPQVSGKLLIGLLGMMGCEPAKPTRPDRKCRERHSSRPGERFDGIFANAALFHVPSQELPRVLRQLHAALKPGGVLFSSNPGGANEEGWDRGRYGACHSLEAWRRYMSDAGFTELECYYRPIGVRREQQPWLASVWRRPTP